MMQAFLAPAGAAGLRCLGCAAVFPVVDGVPVLLPQAQTPVGDALDPDLIAGMKRAQAGPLQALLTERVASLRPPVLDLGCGTQDWGRPEVLGLDPRLPLLQARGGSCVVADAHEPPLAPESFSAVCALNLLDCVKNPVLVLAWADALLVQGGELLIAMPFAWHEVVPERLRFDWEMLVASLEGRSDALGLRLRYAVHSQWRDVAWPVEGPGRPSIPVQVLQATKGPTPGAL